MTYDEIATLCTQLGYNDKLRLAQLLFQLAKKDEEEQNLQGVMENNPAISGNIANVVQDVVRRLTKLKPSKRSSLLNSIASMFQFQGGISEADKELIVSELQRLEYIRIDKNDKVKFLNKK